MKKDGTANQLLLANRETSDIGDFLPKNYPHALGQMIIEPDNDIRNQGLRLTKNKANWDSFVLSGCNIDPTDRDGVWKMGSTSSQFRIQKQQDEAYDYKGLIIDFDCTSLKFNNQLVSPLRIEYATQQTLGIGVFEFFTWGKATLLNNRVYISIGITHSNPSANPNYDYTLFSFMYDVAKPKCFEDGKKGLKIITYAQQNKLMMLARVNYIAIWASPQYASDVGEIMDSINKNSLAQHITFEKNARRTIDRLNEEVMEEMAIADDLADDIEQLVPRTVGQQYNI
ncbi:MAG: hypothetical protein EZS28_035407 [Streblomastix strix]|uniref:Uncharacterized protein n=1 Tax=Streblomastix strix TaxID=222440 RepID=A0A5J4UE72_9EUKA|nr:MAG: hypothetical protein EZS28_035407 [Streblomastix strix]